MEFKDLSLKEIIAKIKDGTTTQNEVYRYFLGRIDEVNPQIEAFNTINRECNDVSATSELAGAPI